MASKQRARRVADRIHQELAVVLQREIADPRLSMVTVTGVEVDRELAFATVFITVLDAKEREQDVFEALESARGYLQSALADRIALRSLPRLRFEWDTSLEYAKRIEELLDGLDLDGGFVEGEDADDTTP